MSDQTLEATNLETFQQQLGPEVVDLLRRYPEFLLCPPASGVDERGMDLHAIAHRIATRMSEQLMRLEGHLR